MQCASTMELMKSKIGQGHILIIDAMLKALLAGQYSKIMKLTQLTKIFIKCFSWNF